MSKLKELREKRATVYTSIDELRKSADGREMTAEEQTRWVVDRSEALHKLGGRIVFELALSLEPNVKLFDKSQGQVFE